MSAARKGIESLSLCDWIYGMAIDILNSGVWGIEYRYVYYDRKKKAITVRKNAICKNFSLRYLRLDACAEPEAKKIYIAPDSADKSLCLFHECLEILFYDWKEDYFSPKRWRLEKGDDPIRYLEAETWEKLSEIKKRAVKSYLPKGA